MSGCFFPCFLFFSCFSWRAHNKTENTGRSNSGLALALGCDFFLHTYADARLPSFARLFMGLPLQEPLPELPEPLKVICVNSSVGCGYQRLRKALLWPDSKLTSAYSELMVSKKELKMSKSHR